MGKHRAIISSQLILYLFLGTMLFSCCLNLFQTSWLSFQSCRRLMDESNDFMHVSERIKYDLLKEIRSITVSENDFTFSFLQYADNGLDYVERDYTVMMRDGKLIYNIWNGTGYTGIYLSSLVQNLRLEREGDLLILILDYGDYSFRRCYRIDHIEKKRFLNSFSHSSPDQPECFFSGAFPDQCNEPEGEFDFLL